MKRLILSSWFVLPALLLAYHYGPGQKQSALDEVALMTQAAHHYAEDAQWEKAIDLYDQSLQSMPEGEEALSRRIRLEKAKAQMMASQLPEARESLVALMDEVSGDEQSEAGLGDEVRQSLANAEFYLTWLMRLEGVDEATWRRHAESARQHYGFLATQPTTPDKESTRAQHQRDLESAIQLARMDLGDLQGLPLPSQ